MNTASFSHIDIFSSSRAHATSFFSPMSAIFINSLLSFSELTHYFSFRQPAAISAFFHYLIAELSGQIAGIIDISYHCHAIVSAPASHCIFISLRQFSP